MGLVARKPVFGVSDKARLKPDSSATETSKNIAISLETSLDMILSNKRIIKALMSLRGCAGWSMPVLFANPRRQVFFRRGPNSKILMFSHQKQDFKTVIVSNDSLTFVLLYY